MKMNVKRLCKMLAEAPEEETVSTAGCNDYLLNHVFWPTVDGNAPRLGQIDYDRFDEEDIGWIAEFYNHAWNQGQRLEQLGKVIGNFKPVPCRTRQFC